MSQAIRRRRRPLVQATLESGKALTAQTLLYAVGRQGTTAALHLDKAGLKADDRERLKVNEHYQTEVPHIYAVGDVIGFPALASTAMEQGRLAVCHAFGVPTDSHPRAVPLWHLCHPGNLHGRQNRSPADRRRHSLRGRHRPISRTGPRTTPWRRHDGMLKLLIHQDNHQILGVHAIGTGATELIHIGQAVMAFKARSNTSSTTCSTSPRWPKRTRWRP